MSVCVCVRVSVSSCANGSLGNPHQMHRTVAHQHVRTVHKLYVSPIFVALDLNLIQKLLRSCRVCFFRVSHVDLMPIGMGTTSITFAQYRCMVLPWLQARVHLDTRWVNKEQKDKKG